MYTPCVCLCIRDAFLDVGVNDGSVLVFFGCINRDIAMDEQGEFLSDLFTAPPLITMGIAKRVKDS